MQTAPLKIYKSSAGSGKTFTLTLEYLKIALRDPFYFKHILAVTFTNKATQEMKNRILDELAKLKSGDPSPLLQPLMDELQLSETQVRKQSAMVLSAILHHYSYFSINTIDSFFQRVIRSFAREVGLRGGFTVELDTNKVLDTSIDSLLEDLGKNNESKGKTSFTDWLVQFAEAKVEDGKSWDIKKEMIRLGSEIFKEDFKRIEAEILAHASDPDFFKRLSDQLKKTELRFKSEMEKIAKEALNDIDVWGAKLDDFAHGASGPANYFNRIVYNGDFDPKERARKVIEDPSQWVTKKAPKRDFILELADKSLNELLLKAVTMYDTEIVEYNTARSISRNLYVFGILAELSLKLEEYRREQGVMLISDASIFLKQVIAENDAPFIFEKAGTFFHHFLIDEFQDTSTFQWENFKHLIDNSLASGNTNLLVGDVKQSIYRWRGSDWRLLLNGVKEEVGEDYITELALDTNWRSSKHVIEFNNHLFAHAPQLLMEKLLAGLSDLNDESLNRDLLAKIKQLEQAYSESNQALGPKKDADGWVEIAIATEPESDEEPNDLNFKSRAIALFIEQVEQLQLQGYALRDLTILVRTAADGRAIAQALMEYKESELAKPGLRYEVISSEALQLSASVAVQLMMAAIAWLHLQDELSEASIKTHHAVLHGLDINHALFTDQPDAAILHLKSQRGMLSKLPLFELSEALIQLFGLQQLSHEFVYLQTLQEAIYEYSKDRKSDLGSLLDWWEQQGKTLSIKAPAGMDAMKIITIHRSKGLEFSVVLIPFCNWKLDHNTSGTIDQTLWVKTEARNFKAAGFVPVKYSQGLKETHFSKDYYDELIQIHLDNLNLLYVALTRAKEGLFMVIPPSKNNFQGSKLNHVGEILGVYLLQGWALPVMELVGDDRYRWGTIPLKTISSEQNQSALNLQHYLSTDWRQRVVIKRRGKQFFEQGKPEIKAKINYGLLVHEVLAGIRHRDQLEQRIQQLYQLGELNHEAIAQLQLRLVQLMEIPLMKTWFEHRGMIKNEAAIMLTDGSTLRPDRVIWWNDRVVVVDFKTGVPNPTHQKQVREYAQRIAEIEKTRTEGYLVYIETGSIEQV